MNMAQKRVTFEVAKALIEAGYPIVESIMYHSYFGKINFDNRPTWLDAWLWLWQHKGIWLDPVKTGAELFTCYLSGEHIIGYHSNPEEAIEAAIEYIVNNNLLK